MRKGIIFWSAIAVIGLGAFLGLHDKAFPTAAINLQVTRSQVQELAASYLNGLGVDLGGYRSAVIFDTDTAAAAYLQRELGMDRANALGRDEVPVYFWGARWFRPLEVEEYVVGVTPDGRVLGYLRKLSEEAAGASLEQDAARGIAEDFLRGQGVDLGAYEAVDISTKRHKERTDHTFEWRKRDFEAGQAQLRLKVTVQGDRVGELVRYLKVPEEFERSYAQERATGTLITVVTALLLTLALAVGALVVFLRAYKAGELRWRFALAAAALLVVLSIAAILNSLPLIEFQYQTEVGFGTFLGITLSITTVSAFIYGVWILLKGGAGEYLARQQYPHTLQTLHDLLARRFTRELAFSSLRGYALGFGFLGYIVIFYLAGQKFFDVWVPTEGPQINILNTTAPFLYPLLVGVTAALSEEFAYRLFAIPFLKQYVRWTFIALLIPAVIWAFAHSSYEISPVYVRGIELTLAGLAFGYCFIRYDLWTVLVAHYVIDAFLISLPLLKSGNSYFQVSGAAVILLGLVPVMLTMLGLLYREHRNQIGRRE